MEPFWDIPQATNFDCLSFQYTSILSCFMIVLSVTVYCLNTLPSLQNLAAWTSARHAIDVFCMCWFTIEFAVRVLVCPNKKNFVKSFSNWIDFLSVIPSYLKLFSIKDSLLVNLVLIRLLRVFRFFKLSYGLQVLLHTLKASFYELILLLLILLIPIVVFSSLVHTVENKLGDKSSTKFISIPATFWWCLITMTSVGYGDMVPETWAGKIIGSLCAICGVLIVALPISVIGSNFSLYYAHVRARLKLPSKDRKLLAGNIRGLLKQPLSLSSRERDRRISKRANLPALKRKGASRSRAVNETLEHLTPTASSDEESGLESSTNQLSSSAACLDWDCTVDSEIRFPQQSSRRKKKQRRKCKEPNSALDCESLRDAQRENSAVRKSRRRSRTTLFQLEKEGVPLTNYQHGCQTESASELDNVSSNGSTNEKESNELASLSDKNSLLSTACSENSACSKERTRERRSPPHRRRISMKLIDIEMSPTCSTNTVPSEKDREGTETRSKEEDDEEKSSICNHQTKQLASLKSLGEAVNRVASFDVPDIDAQSRLVSELSDQNALHFESHSCGGTSRSNWNSDTIFTDAQSTEKGSLFPRDLKRPSMPNETARSVGKDVAGSESFRDARENLHGNHVTSFDARNMLSISRYNMGKKKKSEFKKKLSKSELSLVVKNHVHERSLNTLYLRKISSNLELGISESEI